ncbi:MAG: tetraacyldisaccharide 4'-kinase [Bacteroidales bacterium]
MKKAIFYILSFPYRIGVGFRHALYNIGLIKTHSFNVSIISVGNITVGGTGKTPHVEYIQTLLSKDGKYKVAVLSRGYKRKSRGFKYVEIDSNTESVGDEPLQIKQNCPNAIVAVNENRPKGIKKLLEEHPDIDVVLLDDGFQRRDVAKDLDILLIDYNRPIHTDTWLPYGSLRDSKRRATKANIVIYTKCPDDLKPYSQRLLTKHIDTSGMQSVFFTRISYSPIQALFGTSSSTPQPEAILAISGIAKPKPFVEHIKTKFDTENISALQFPDHHNFSEADYSNIEAKFNEIETDNKIIITTQKDAVRILTSDNVPESLKNSIFMLPIQIDFISEEMTSEFKNKILKYVEENKGNRRLYTK